ncbi:MAG TPA: homoserine kinase [Nitrososphaeraceae archaeon]|nr:homoserine kinase [Nitrososphaeraceae archaeon]
MQDRNKIIIIIIPIIGIKATGNPLAMQGKRTRLSSSDSVTAAAPSSTANLGPGFDIFGLAVDAFEDYVTIYRTSNKHLNNAKPLEDVVEDASGVSSVVHIEVTGEYCRSIPVETNKNSAGLAIQKILKDFDIKGSFSVIVQKNIPPGFGMGSSAASAAAAVMALDALLNLRISKPDLIRCAAEGEKASAGSLHYDNVAASILGGFVLVRAFATPQEFINIEAPKNLRLVFAIPSLDVPPKKTELARKVLPDSVPLSKVVLNVSNAATVVAGFLLKDVYMIARGVEDAIVEPSRKHLIPCFDEVRKNALQAGALAVTISGAGPSVVSFISGDDRLEAVANSMRTGFGTCGLNCNTIKCSPSEGARIVSCNKTSRC